MKVGSLVTSNTRVYLDPPDMLVGDDEESSWSDILEKDYKDIPFGPHQVGIVVAIRATNIMKHAMWIKVLTPNGMGVCFSDELEEIQPDVT